MAKSRMTGRERILAAIRHEEPDRIPISPRVGAWLTAEYGDASPGTLMEKLPDVDVMHIVGDGTPNYLDAYPDTYDLPEVRVDQKQYQEGEVRVVERTFHTPAGDLSDRTIIPPAGGIYGVSPNPFRTEHLVKGPEDLDALIYLLHEVNTHFDFLRDDHEQVGDRGG